MNAEELWTAAAERLRQELDPETHALWIACLKPHSYEDNHLVLAAPTPLAADWCKRRLHRAIWRALRATNGTARVSIIIGRQAHPAEAAEIPPPAPPTNPAEALPLSRPIAYWPQLAAHVGPTAALVLSQLLYWHGRGADEHGWTWKTNAELCSETGLTRHQLLTAKRLLISAGLVHVRYHGMPRRTWYLVNIPAIGRLLQ